MSSNNSKLNECLKELKKKSRNEKKLIYEKKLYENDINLLMENNKKQYDYIQEMTRIFNQNKEIYERNLLEKNQEILNLQQEIQSKEQELERKEQEITYYQERMVYYESLQRNRRNRNSNNQRNRSNQTPTQLNR